MDITIYPKKLSGTVRAIPSKSQAHRLLICAAFADTGCYLHCPATNRDIQATADCLQALGADIQRTEEGYRVSPIRSLPQRATLNCGESGSTLRFMLPICAALGVETEFLLEGRLPHRPLSPLWEELERMGAQLSRPTPTTVLCSGKLHCGEYIIDAGVSSQFITGLLFALALLNGDCRLTVTGNVESRPYITMTENALSLFGISCQDYHFSGNQRFHAPKQLCVEGDWSNGAFFLTARAMGCDLEIEGLDPNSPQGDRQIVAALQQLSQCSTVDGRDIPDLIPILAVYAGYQAGATFVNIGRLRLKESDRILAVTQMLTALGITAISSDTQLQVLPGCYQGGTVDAKNDHRIAMAAAIAATAASGPVTILGAECVSKSYPDFWSVYKKLGGYYEQYIR